MFNFNKKKELIKSLVLRNKQQDVYIGSLGCSLDDLRKTHKIYRTTILTLLDVVATNHPAYTEDVLRLKKTAI